jgi:hypothetical protein
MSDLLKYNCYHSTYCGNLQVVYQYSSLLGQFKAASLKFIYAYTEESYTFLFSLLVRSSLRVSDMLHRSRLEKENSAWQEAVM